MQTFRIIPRLEIKSNNLVKGMRMEGLRIIGDPLKYALKYYNEGADEIIYEDIVATLYSRNFDLKCIKRICKNIFIPATVSGGIKSDKDINDCLNSGASKISINTEFFFNTKLISSAAKRFGRQCISVQLQYQKIGERNICFHTSGRENTGVDVSDAAKIASNSGAGEIQLVSINHDGMLKGTDFKLLEKMRKLVKIPIIAGGGIGSIEDIKKIKKLKIDGVIVSSILHDNKIKIGTIKKKINQKLLNIR